MPFCSQGILMGLTEKCIIFTIFTQIIIKIVSDFQILLYLI